MNKRCPKGTRKNKEGKCVQKGAKLECEKDREMYMERCYKKCKPTQHRNPETRRCRRTCEQDEVRSPITRKCVKVKNSKKRNKTPKSTPRKSRPSKKSIPTIKSIGSIKLKTPVILPELAIQIDNIQFQMIGKIQSKNYLFVGVLGYSIMPLYGLKPYSFFWVYPSKSELGMWRLAGSRMFGGGFSKLDEYISSKQYPNYFYSIGDYVQSTLIHLDLQKFLSDNLDNPLVTSLSETDATDILTFINNNPNKTYPNINESNLEIPYENNVNLRGATLSPPLIEKRGDQHLELNQSLRAVHNVSNIKYPFPFVFMSGVHDEEKGFQCGQYPGPERLNTFSKILSEVYNIQSVDMVSNKLNTFEEIIDVKGKIFRVLLTRKDNINPKFLMLDMHEFRSVSDKMIPINPETDILPAVVLYYMEVSMNCSALPSNVHIGKINRICNKEKHYMPILLTVPEERINIFGVYNKYINSGQYICKLFDYTKQCSFNEASNDVCTNTYTYIGSRYEKLFPYNIIAQ
jgi:hypothetical protein